MQSGEVMLTHSNAVMCYAGQGFRALFIVGVKGWARRGSPLSQINAARPAAGVKRVAFAATDPCAPSLLTASVLESCVCNYHCIAFCLFVEYRLHVALAVGVRHWTGTFLDNPVHEVRRRLAGARHLRMDVLKLIEYEQVFFLKNRGRARRRSSSLSRKRVTLETAGQRQLTDQRLVVKCYISYESRPRRDGRIYLLTLSVVRRYGWHVDVRGSAAKEDCPTDSALCYLPLVRNRHDSGASSTHHHTRSVYRRVVVHAGPWDPLCAKGTKNNVGLGRG